MLGYEPTMLLSIYEERIKDDNSSTIIQIRLFGLD